MHQSTQTTTTVSRIDIHHVLTWETVNTSGAAELLNVRIYKGLAKACQREAENLNPEDGQLYHISVLERYAHVHGYPIEGMERETVKLIECYRAVRINGVIYERVHVDGHRCHV